MAFRAFHLVACALLVAPATAHAKTTILVNRIGPSDGQLYIANGDGSGERALMTGGRFDYDASLSADGEWIVFTSERRDSADVYRVKIDGSGLERLTEDSAFDDQGALSPDGKQLAFVSTRGTGKANIWVLDLATRGYRNLTGTAALQAEAGKMDGFFRPAWSPDGQWLAFSSDRNTDYHGHGPGAGFEHIQAASIYIMRTDGSGLRKLTDDAQCSGSPKWSADGKRIVFYSLAAADTFAARGFGPPPASDIVAIDIASGTRTVYASGTGLKVSPQFVGPNRVGYLAKGPGQRGEIVFSTGERGVAAPAAGVIRNPAWSADGAKLVYEKFAYDSHQGQELLTENDDFKMRFSGEFPSASKDGRVVLSPFGELGGSANKPLDQIALSLTDVEGRSVSLLFESKSGAAYSPAWSPDGQWIAFGFGRFFQDRESKPARLMLIRPDGSETRDLPSGPLNAGFPSWSPDGKRIVYRVWSQTERGLRILNLADGAITKLTDDNDNFPTWSPAGDRIAFTRNTGPAMAYDVFTLRPDGSDLKQLTASSGNDAHSAWSSDGKYIVFSTSRLGFRDEAPLYDGSPQPYAELFVMNADGSNPRAVSDDKWEEGTPAWVSDSGN